jgi:H+/Cl- antiporter ClcA
VTRDAAALVAILAIMGGWFGRRLWQANDDVRSLRQRLEAARRAWRRALVLALLVGAAIYAAAYHWVHVHGG